MPRKDLKAKDRRDTQIPDPVYKSVLFTRFVNKLILGGKKTKAENLMYKALEKVKEKSGEDALATFTRAIDNVRPLLEVRARRVGGATYQVPSEVRPERGIALAIRWMITYTRAKSGRPMSERLAEEILAASKKRRSFR